MKTAQLVSPRNFQIKKMPAPEGSNFKPMYVGLCGSDITFYRGDGEYPKPIGFPGHEILGIVTKGETASILAVADCGCGFQEKLFVDTDRLIPMPRFDSPRQLTLSQPLGCVLHAMEKIKDKVSGCTVMILGQGTIGLLFDSACRLYGAEGVIGVDPLFYRAQLGLKMGAGAVHAIPAKAVREKADIVIEACGEPQTIREAIRLAKEAVLYFGGPKEKCAVFPMDRFYRGNLVLFSHHGSTGRSIAAAAHLIATGKIDVSPLITHIFSMDRIGEAFDCFADRRNGAVKVLIKI